ncbi:MAG: hypothetical protein QXY87_10765 [Saccharolobus sp.]|uniref:hypothetical protein n=2 Tax=Sulfolobaceae TaxID=118883 RepID=UPI001F0E2AC7|nr:hypothetical protein [Saccharolobus shibatae]MCH4816304.1 hypothetical protein [Saccharolobus shibatae]
MNKKYYIVIASVISVTIVLLALLNFNTVIFLYTKYFDPHSIDVFFFKGSKMLTNVSVSLFAFYPTKNGTVFKKIYQGFNLKYFSIPLSNLTDYAGHWIKHYGYNITPSLVGFASYYINNPNGTITIYSQPFSISVSPYNVTHGIGKTVVKEFINPVEHIVKRRNGNSVKANTITTTTTSVPTTSTSAGTACEIVYVLNSVWYYPSNNSLGPIPLSIAYVTDPNTNDYSGDLGLGIGSSTQSGYKISFGITYLSFINMQVAGISITANANSFSVKKEVYLGSDYGVNSQFAEIYTYGQIAVANYSYWIGYGCPPGAGVGIFPPNGYCIEVLVTGLEVNGTTNNYSPAIYDTNTPLIPPTDFFSFTNNLTKVYVIEPHQVGTYFNFSTTSTTSYGYVSGSIPAGLIITKLASRLGIFIPLWVTLVISPSVSIVQFTNYDSVEFTEITLASSSNDAYYIYMAFSNNSFTIGSSTYHLPYYYYYINYTT